MTIAEDTRRLCNEIASSSAARREENSERRSSVGRFLKEVRDDQFRLGRGLRKMGNELRKSLALDERHRLDAAVQFGSTLATDAKQRAFEVGSMLNGFRDELADFARENGQRAAAVQQFLADVRNDMQAAAAAWRGTAPQATHTFQPTPPKPGRGRNDKEKEILRVVMGHPKGLRLTQIGSMLRTDWRSLNAPTRNLVATSKLRKANNLYFSV
jgi:hypothetical protein